MDRGYNGNHIFEGNKNKSQFLDYLEGAAKQMKIPMRLKYKEIAEMSVLGNLGFASLRELYQRTKQGKGKA